LLGSVSRRVLQIARRPVMIVPATMNTNEAAA
jgi:nucleotide-binding universal stress UspA family protein